MTTETGAFRIFSPLVPLDSAASLSFASWLTHQIIRAGSWLADVGPIFIRSQIARNSSSLTGASV